MRCSFPGCNQFRDSIVHDACEPGRSSSVCILCRGTRRDPTCHNFRPRPVPAVEAVEAIIRDLTDRRGLKSEWARIAPDIQEDIKTAWADIIEIAYGRHE